MSSADLARLAGECVPQRYAEVVAKEDIAETEWLKLQTVTYRLGGKKDRVERTWNMASRTTKREGSDYADSVLVLGLCSRGEPSFDTEVILIRQFRPPHGMMSVELPAGLIDPGEGVADAALREVQVLSKKIQVELKNEKCIDPTQRGNGVHRDSKIYQSHPLTESRTDESIQLCVVDVDLNAPANQNPIQNCDEDEDIEVLTVKLRNFIKMLREFKNDRIVQDIYLFALGFQLGSQQGVLQVTHTPETEFHLQAVKFCRVVFVFKNVKRATTPDELDTIEEIPLTKSGYHKRPTSSGGARSPVMSHATESETEIRSHVAQRQSSHASSHITIPKMDENERVTNREFKR